MDKKILLEPNELLNETFDCLWISLSSKLSKNAEKLLLWLDWKLRGKITRIKPFISNSPLYIYVQKELPFSYIVLIRNSFEIETVKKIIKDLNLNKVFFFSDSSISDTIEDGLPIFKLELAELEKS